MPPNPYPHFSLEELRLIARCIAYTLVQNGLPDEDWRDAKVVMDEIAEAIHEMNLRREDEGSATINHPKSPTESDQPFLRRVNP